MIRGVRGKQEWSPNEGDFCHSSGHFSHNHFVSENNTKNHNGFGIGLYQDSGFIDLSIFFPLYFFQGLAKIGDMRS